MRKTDKKIDNQLRLALTDVCETALKDIDGFQWLTHRVDYANFPASFKVICIFETNEQRSIFTDNSDKKLLISLIHKKLNEIGIKFNNIANHIVYDTEENCTDAHQGNWAKRLS